MSFRNIVFFACLSFLLLTGCNEQIQNTSDRSLSNHRDLKDYIAELPAVKSVRNWDGKFGQGMVINTAHYEIYTTLKEPLMLRQIPGFIESAYRGYQKYVPTELKTNSRFKIYLFADRQQWDEFTKDFTRPNEEIYLKINRGAYYLNGSCVAYNIGRSKTLSVLGHESWHQFNSRHFKYRLPSWLDEGLAMHFETSKYNNGWFNFTPDRNLGRLGALKLILKKGKVIPLERLIQMNPGQVLIHPDSDAALSFYAQAYALVRFLREADYCRRLMPYNKMLIGGLKGRWPLGGQLAEIASNRNIPMTARSNAVISKIVFEKYIGSDYNALQKDYMKFCDKITRRIIIEVGNDG